MIKLKKFLEFGEGFAVEDVEDMPNEEKTLKQLNKWYNKNHNNIDESFFNYNLDGSEKE